jgi:hypothetical protein
VADSVDAAVAVQFGRFEVLALVHGMVARDGGEMSDPSRPPITGLLPRAVRIALDPGQVQLLTRELVTRLEQRAAALREDHERDGTLSTATLAEAADWLHEYRTLLEALTPQSGRRAPATITASTVAADTLIRACTTRAGRSLLELCQARSGDIDRLRDAGAAAAAWAQTLADLRELDETAPDTVLD